MSLLALSTPDPAFDPAKPLTVNGYLYVPAADHGVGVPPREPAPEEKD